MVKDAGDTFDLYGVTHLCAGAVRLWIINETLSSERRLSQDDWNCIGAVSLNSAYLDIICLVCWKSCSAICFPNYCLLALNARLDDARCPSISEKRNLYANQTY